MDFIGFVRNIGKARVDLDDGSFAQAYEGEAVTIVERDGSKIELALPNDFSRFRGRLLVLDELPARLDGRAWTEDEKEKIVERISRYCERRLFFLRVVRE